MTNFLRITLVLAALLPTDTVLLAQTPAPDSLERARQRAREAAERAREAARELREEEARERRTRERAPRETDRGPEVTDTVSRTIRVGARGALDLANISGNIVITGGPGDDMKIDAVKRVRHQNADEARALLQAIDVRITVRGNQVDVRTDYPRGRRNWSGGVDYTVAVPTGTALTLRSVSGEIRVSNIGGELWAESVSGSVTATSVQRLRGARSVSGNVNLSNVSGDDVTAGTVSGNVVVAGAKLRALEIEAVSGDLRFTDAEIERVTLHTISGDIDFAGRLVRNGRYRFQSQSGDIHLVPASGTGFDLDASSFSGAVRSDVEFRNGATVETPRIGPRTQSLRGTVGDASAVITVRSFSGEVIVSKP